MVNFRNLVQKQGGVMDFRALVQQQGSEGLQDNSPTPDHALEVFLQSLDMGQYRQAVIGLGITTMADFRQYASADLKADLVRAGQAPSLFALWTRGSMEIV